MKAVECYNADDPPHFFPASFFAMETIMEREVTCNVAHPLVSFTLLGAENKDGFTITGLLLYKKTPVNKNIACNTGNPGLMLYADAIGKFLDGSLHDLSGIPIDLSWCSPFTKKVLLAARKLVRGETVSYAELARRAGNGRAVRAAASVMRNNRFPLIIPCHRVIKSDGSIGGFMGKQTGDAVVLKKTLLSREALFKSGRKSFSRTLKLF